MKLTVDTNILLRAARDDNLEQTELARHMLRTASLVAIPLVVLCEYVWVMRSAYKRPSQETHDSVAAIVSADNVVVDRDAVEVGLRFIKAGGDFADGVIAFEGRRLGGISFASFDRGARNLAVNAGFKVAVETS